MKATEFLARKKDDLVIHPILILTGDDELLKEIVCDVFGKATGLYPDAQERLKTEDARMLAGEWAEGSLMGARFIRAYAGVKFKNVASLEEVRYDADTMDRMVLITPPEWKPPKKSEALSSFFEVTCSSPRTLKERQKLIRLRATWRGFELSEDLAKVLAERSTNVTEIESSVATLQLLSKVGHVSLKDVQEVAGEPVRFRDVTRAILMGNTIRLTKEILDGDPMPVLQSGINSLVRLYTWLNSSEDDEEAIIEQLKIPKRQLKEWKAARNRFSPQLIREVLHDWSGTYQKIRSGRSDDWRERLRLSIAKMNPK